MNSSFTQPTKSPWVLLFIAVCLVGANLRMTFTGIGPLLDEIGASEGMSTAALGLLTSVPLFTWALLSSFAHAFSAKVGMSNAVSWSLLALTIGTVWRSLPGTQANIWIGMALVGAGIAFCNVLMPAVIKRDFGARVPLVMGVYTAMLSAFASLAAGVVVPLSLWAPAGEPLGWRIALMATGTLAPVALVVWFIATRPQRTLEAAEKREAASASAPGNERVARRIWGDRTAWVIAVYMGTQSGMFYMMAAWLAPYSLSLGRSATQSGVDLMLFQFTGIAGSMLLPFVLRGKLRSAMPMLLPIVAIVGWVGIVLAPGTYLVWVLIGGLACGASLTMSLTIIAMRSHTQMQAAALSGMAQTVGYLIAAIGPPLLGMIHDFSANWTIAFALVWLFTLVQFIAGWRLRKPRMVLGD